MTGGSTYKNNIVLTVLLHKYEGANIGVNNFVSKVSISFLTRANMKSSYGNTGRTKGIGIILCQFHNCPNIYPMGPVYYFPDDPLKKYH